MLMLAILIAVTVRADDARESWEQGVVGLVVTYQSWDEDRPWAKQPPRTRTANAVLVGERRLMTTADMIAHATLLQLAVNGRTLRVEPRVVHIDRAINLALLEFDPDEATVALAPVALADETPTSGVLRTVRWRRQQLEALASDVVRFEVESSWSSRVEHAFLHLRTDMTNGGWSEPIFAGERLVGLTVSQSQQNSRAIPAEILGAFLERVDAPGGYVGFPTLGVLWQVNRDVHLARFLGQQGEPRGMLVRQVPWGSSGCGVLQPRDLVLAIEGHAIDAEGYYLHPRLGRLRANHLLAEGYRIGDTIELTVNRAGEELTLTTELRGYPAELDRIPGGREGQPPYLIFGGLLMRELDLPYLKSWGKEWSRNAPISLITRYQLRRAGQGPGRRRTVLITSVLPTAYNLGYQDVRDEVVERVNGREISTLADAFAALEAPVDGFHVIELARDAVRGEVVLDAAGFDAAVAEVLETYRIPAAMHLPDTPLPAGGGDCPGNGH